MGTLPWLSGNKQWPVDNDILALLSSSYSYIRATGMPTVGRSIAGVAYMECKKCLMYFGERGVKTQMGGQRILSQPFAIVRET